VELGTLRLASLLHDVGKVAVRAGKKGDHAALGSEICAAAGLGPKVAQAVAGHKTDPFMLAADNALLEAKDDEAQPYAKRMANPFSRVSGIKEGVQAPKEATFYPLSMTGKATPMAEPMASAEDYKAILESLSKDLKATRHGNAETILEVLRHRLACVPESEAHPDVSMFDHLHLHAALSEAALRGGAVAIIAGDVSGIQAFIYSSREGQEDQSKMVKRLRGRSLIVDLACRSACDHILESLDLTRASMAWCTGGQFLILAPAAEGWESRFREARTRINSDLMRMAGGDLFLALGAHVCSLDELKDGYGDQVAKARGNAEKEKRRRFLEDLKAEDLLSPPVEPCRKCGMDLVGGACPVCVMNEKVGQLLPTTRYIVQSHGPGGHVEFRSMGHSWHLTSSKEDAAAIIRGGGRIRISSINTADPLDKDLAGMAGEGVSFHCEDLGLCSVLDSGVPQGTRDEERKAVVRLDVDNLGQVISSGGGVARACAMSRLLDAFFKGVVNDICTARNVMGGQLYVVYAGGDDVFLYGKWDDCIDAALDINKAFTRFTGGNPNVTISGGVAVFKGRYPIGRAGESAGELLDGLAKNMKGKDSVALFGEVVHWRGAEDLPIFNDLESLVSFSRRLQELYAEGKVSHAIVRSLLDWERLVFPETGTDVLEANEKLNGTAAMTKRGYMPRLLYRTARNIEGEELRKEMEAKLAKSVPFAGVVVCHFDYSTREERQRGVRNG
jgi:CRISPR-associated protein Csm1